MIKPLNSIRPLPKAIEKIVAAAEKFHGRSIAGQEVHLPANYTPFPGTETPRYTRYFEDGRAANIEVYFDNAFHTLRVYGSNIYEFKSMTDTSYDMPWIKDEEAENYRMFEQIKSDSKKFLRAYTLSELGKKLNFFNKMQNRHIEATGEVLAGLPFPVHSQKVELDVKLYRKSFLEEGNIWINGFSNTSEMNRISAYMPLYPRAAQSELMLNDILKANMKRHPYQLSIAFKGISMRICDLYLIGNDNDVSSSNQKLFEPFFLSLFGQTVLDEKTLKEIVVRYCNSLITTMNLIHSYGKCIWTKKYENRGMGNKDVSITGNIFDPDPQDYSKAGEGFDRHEILRAMLNFLRYFEYKFPKSTISSLEEETIKETGFVNDKKMFYHYSPPMQF